MKKKILLLGGSYGQLPAIYEAKRRNLYIILCDYLPDNPGRNYVDEYHSISTTDKESVYALAKEKKVDAVFAFASDPATPTAAYVSEKLHLPCSSYQSVLLLSQKDRYRRFLKDNGFPTPDFTIISNPNDSKLTKNELSYPGVVKPVDASDTKGVRVVYDDVSLLEAYQFALSFSKVKKVIFEKYVEASRGNLHGDAFFLNGKMMFCMLGDRLFSSHSNPLKPSTELYPTRVSESLIKKVEHEIAAIIDKSGFKNGAVNIEARIDGNGDIYIMEIGPRSGGTLTPQTIYHSCGFDMLKATFDWLINSNIEIIASRTVPSICFALHTNEYGIFKELKLGHDLQKFIAEKHIFVHEGEPVKPYSEPGSTIGVLIFKFQNFEQVDKIKDTLYEAVQSSIVLSNSYRKTHK